MMPIEFPGSSLEHDSFSCPMGREAMGRSQTHVSPYAHVFVYVILVGQNSEADRYGYYVTLTVGGRELLES